MRAGIRCVTFRRYNGGSSCGYSFWLLGQFFSPPRPTRSFDAYWSVCSKGRGEAVIYACNWVLKSEKLTAAQRPLAYWYRCWANLVAMRRYPAAVADCSEAIKLNPKDPRFWLDRGLAWARLGRYERSIPDYTEAIRLKPDYAIAYNNRAIDHRKTRQWDKAIADFRMVVKLRPDHPRAYRHLANLYEFKKDHKNARAILTEALKRFPRDAGAILIRRARVHEAMGDKQAAAADYREALKIDPKDDVAREGLRRVAGE